LIIVDTQKGMHSPTLYRRNNPYAQAHIQQMLTLWRAACWLVITTVQLLNEKALLYIEHY
jgi:hypothetical protein